MITSIGIRNLRSLRDTSEIDIKPITILVGVNSSGKSTFLRSFPLFTQSIIKPIRGSISWFDDSLVDFGDYETEKNKCSSPDDKIQFYYRLKNVPYIRYCLSVFDWRRSYRMGKDSLLEDVYLKISLSDDNKGTFVSDIVVNCKDIEVSFSVNSRTEKVIFRIGGQKVTGMSSAVFHYTTLQSMLPSVVLSSSQERNYDEYLCLDSCRYDIRKLLLKLNKRVSSEDRANFIFDMWEPDKLSFLNRLLTARQIPSTFGKMFKKWDSDNADFVKLYNMLTIYHVLRVYPSINRELSTFYSNCSYIAPARAEALRFYRTQGLQVNDIDAYGRNLAEFISSLTPSALQDYNKYTDKLLKIKVKKENSPGHQSIVLESGNGKFNISDVGFGYSQMLPIVTKLWYYSYRPNRKNAYIHTRDLGSVILMEQPELHLHPAYQAKLADAFIDYVNMGDRDEDEIFDDSDKKFLIFETHSEAIINRIGRRIREGKLAADAVNVVIFEKTINNLNTTVRQTQFNDKGQLKDWPIGFFEPFDD